MCTVDMDNNPSVGCTSPVPTSFVHHYELEHLGELPVYTLCVWLVQPLVWDVVHGLSEVMHDLLRGPSLALGGEGRERG